jgi:tetratricopeptide (TPR) repeat protein
LCLEAWLGNANVLARVGRSKRSLDCLDVALAVNASDAAALNTQANVFCQIGRQEEALTIYDIVLAIGVPDQAIVWSNKGNALLELNRPQEALTCFDNALKLDGNYVHALAKRAEVMEAMGKLVEATECYSKAIEADPGNLDYWASKGTALLRLGRYDESVYCYDAVLAKNPTNTMALYNKGLALASSKDRMPEALACFQMATQYDPGYIRAWFLRAHLERTLGRCAESIASCKAFLELADSGYENEREKVKEWLTELGAQRA